MSDELIRLFLEFRGMGIDEETAWNMAAARMLDNQEQESLEESEDTSLDGGDKQGLDVFPEDKTGEDSESNPG